MCDVKIKLNFTQGSFSMTEENHHVQAHTIHFPSCDDVVSHAGSLQQWKYAGRKRHHGRLQSTMTPLLPQKPNRQRPNLIPLPLFPKTSAMREGPLPFTMAIPAPRGTPASWPFRRSRPGCHLYPPAQGGGSLRCRDYRV